MSDYKEIVTKAVIGKGKRATDDNYSIVPENNPDTVLGCWIINHQFGGKTDKDDCLINGSFDVNIWYSYDNDTKTAATSKSFTYQDRINVPITQKSRLSNEKEVILTSLSDPTVSDVKVENGEIKFTVHKETAVEVVGDALIRVNAYELVDNYEELGESFNSTLNNIDNEINENYLTENNEEIKNSEETN